MAAWSYRIEPFDKKHDRSHFDSGVEALDIYLRQTAGQDSKRDVASVFVVVDSDTNKICGYYTLAAGSIPYVSVPEDERKGVPKYESLPAVRLGRLAIDKNHQGRRLGEFLLYDAFKYAVSQSIAWKFFIVDAKNHAIGFYLKFGFKAFADDKTKLYIRREALVKLFDVSR
jgi:ribosomal protein S18 acetylase RimI-like enzyme